MTFVICIMVFGYDYCIIKNSLFLPSWFAQVWRWQPFHIPGQFWYRRRWRWGMLWQSGWWRMSGGQSHRRPLQHCPHPLSCCYHSLESSKHSKIIQRIIFSHLNAYLPLLQWFPWSGGHDDVVYTMNVWVLPTQRWPEWGPPVDWRNRA